MSDYTVESGGGFSVPCHAVMMAGLSPFLARAMEGTDRLILADFGIGEVCGLLNFVYTGMYVLYIELVKFIKVLMLWKFNVILKTNQQQLIAKLMQYKQSTYRVM